MVLIFQEEISVNAFLALQEVIRVSDDLSLERFQFRVIFYHSGIILIGNLFQDVDKDALRGNILFGVDTLNDEITVEDLHHARRVI